MVTIPKFIRMSKLFLQAVPDEIDLELLKNNIGALENVQAVSHFHLWSIDGQQHMMSLTVTTSFDYVYTHEKIKSAIRKIAIAYSISHITIEILVDPDRVIQ